MQKIEAKKGTMRVWWSPQVPMNAFNVYVNSVEEAAKLMTVLADYDAFQLENNIKPDYCNAGGLEVYDGGGEWSSWEDDETGEDDPVAYVAALTNEVLS